MIIYKALVGSHAYKTNHPDSDFDFRGVAVPSLDYYIGNGTFDNKQAIQGKVDQQNFEVRKFFKMLLNGSFTILEMLYAPEFEGTYEGLLIRKNRHLFTSKRVLKSMLGFIENAKVHHINRKNLAHAYRVAHQAVFFAEHGYMFLEMKTKAAADYYSIKADVFAPETVSNMIDLVLKDLDDSKLPESPNVTDADSLMVFIISRIIGRELNERLSFAEDCHRKEMFRIYENGGWF